MWGIKTAEFTFWIVAVLLIVFVIFQIVVPILKGTPILPFARHNKKEALNRLAEVREGKEVDDIEETIASISGRGRKAKRS